MTVTTVWNGRALLGEGPVWDAVRSALWFVDIKGRRIHLLHPADGVSTSWTAPTEVGWVLPSADGLLLVGMRDGLHAFDPSTGSFSSVAEVEADLATNRLNDATVAPDGSVLFGSMDDLETSPSGRVYRWDGSVVTPLDVEPVTITNGPAMSPDGRTLYHVDTLGGVIHAFDAHEKGGLTRGRVFARIDRADGSPDGVIADSAGNVWVGLWGGWRARCYSPDGAILREIRLPAANITKIALGGEDLRTAFATSASVGISDVEDAAHAEAGCVFSFRVEIPGQSTPLARLLR